MRRLDQYSSQRYTLRLHAFTQDHCCKLFKPPILVIYREWSPSILFLTLTISLSLSLSLSLSHSHSLSLSHSHSLSLSLSLSFCWFTQLANKATRLELWLHDSFYNETGKVNNFCTEVIKTFPSY